MSTEKNPGRFDPQYGFLGLAVPVEVTEEEALEQALEPAYPWHILPFDFDKTHTLAPVRKASLSRAERAVDVQPGVQ